MSRSAALVLVLTGCATPGLQRTPDGLLQITAPLTPRLRGPIEALSSARLWFRSRPYTPLQCVRTTDGRFGCWGRGALGGLPSVLAGLPRSAWIGCLATDVRAPTCALARTTTDPAIAVRTIAAAEMGVCAALTTGRVRCWDEDSTGGREAWTVRGIWNAVQVVRDIHDACARSAAGVVRCWSSAGDHRRSWPVRIDRAVDVAVGGDTGCAALHSGSVVCWDEASQSHAVAGVAGAVDVEVGSYHPFRTGIDCARLADGGVACWDHRKRSDARRIPGAAHIVELKVGDDFACGLDRDDAVWCWGDNHGFGLGGSPFLAAPARIDHLPPVADVVLGDAAACARTAAGELWCWGDKFAGEVAYRARPTRVAQAARRIALGEREDTGLVAELGDGVYVKDDRDASWYREFDFTDVQQIAAGDRWGCVVRHAGGLRCFRHVDWPWLAAATADRRLIPPPSEVASLAIRGDRGCVALADGRALCWGRGDFDTLGSVVSETHVPIDGAVTVPGLPPVDAITLGDTHACARTTTGSVWCWGDPGAGRSPGADRRPRPIAGLSDVEQVAAGAGFTCIRTIAGEVWCWGRNTHGQVGRGESSPWAAAPSPVPGLTGVTVIAAHGATACAVIADGGVACWGDNSARQASLAVPLRSDHAVPVEASEITWFEPDGRTLSGRRGEP